MTETHSSAFHDGSCRASWRLRDENASPAGRFRTGFTVLELLVAVSVMGVLAAIALPRMPRSAFALWNADRQLLADIRHARAEALTKGDHFRVVVTGASTYEVQRMRLVGGGWVANTPAQRSRTLPAGVTFTQGVGSRFEFNTRGLMVAPAVATRLQMTDARTSRNRYVTVWPSGQVAPL
jgi:prepilin-type N-terminal cleavage/methylation domain-containing protein